MWNVEQIFLVTIINFNASTVGLCKKYLNGNVNGLSLGLLWQMDQLHQEKGEGKTLKHAEIQPWKTPT